MRPPGGAAGEPPAGDVCGAGGVCISSIFATFDQIGGDLSGLAFLGHTQGGRRAPPRTPVLP